MKNVLVIFTLLSSTALKPCAFFIENNTAFPVVVSNKSLVDKTIVEQGKEVPGKLTIQYIAPGNTEQLHNRAQLAGSQEPQFVHANFDVTIGMKKSKQTYHIKQIACSKAHKIDLSIKQIQDWQNLLNNAKKSVEMAQQKKNQFTITAAEKKLDTLRDMRKILRIKPVHK
jgi:hypothetical protein